MSEPLRKAFSRQEIFNAAGDWMNERFKEVKKENPTWYYERLGFLVEFLADTFPKEPFQP
jgi:hypothetical protein